MIHDARYKIKDTYLIHDTGYTIHDAGYRIFLDAGYLLMHDTGYKIQDTGYKNGVGSRQYEEFGIFNPPQRMADLQPSNQHLGAIWYRELYQSLYFLFLMYIPDHA